MAVLTGVRYQFEVDDDLLAAVAELANEHARPLGDEVGDAIAAHLKAPAPKEAPKKRRRSKPKAAAGAKK